MSSNTQALSLTENQIIPVLSKAFGSWHFSIGRRAFTTHELEAHYDNESGVWETKIDRLGFQSAYQKLIDGAYKTHPLLKILQNPKVLDAGIGTGALSAALAQHHEGSINLTGIDISSKMLELAESNLNSAQIDLTLEQADIVNLPYRDNSFDVVLAAHVLEHISQPELALREIYRVLKPGGIVIACITQRSVFGAFIQLLWRTHRVNKRTAMGWFYQSGFTKTKPLGLNKKSISNNFSIGYAAQKPLAVS